MKTTPIILSAVSALLALVLKAPAVACHHDKDSGAAEDPHAGHRQATAQAAARDENRVDVEIKDLELRDQDGQIRRLSSDVIGDKLVAMTFVYSSCTTICPIYSALFTQIQELLGDRLDRDVVLVTLTLDPATDVPLRLKREAEKYSARPGWVYLTGDKGNVDEVLRGLDAYFADFTQHPPMALIGDGRTGTWRRYNGFPRPERVVRMLEELEAARGDA